MGYICIYIITNILYVLKFIVWLVLNSVQVKIFDLGEFFMCFVLEPIGLLLTWGGFRSGY